MIQKQKKKKKEKVLKEKKRKKKNFCKRKTTGYHMFTEAKNYV